jgi:hypothetical protein
MQFLLTTLLQLYLIIPYISFFSCTCWVPTISVLSLAIFPLLLKPAAQKMKIVSNSLMRSSKFLPQLLIPVDYGAFLYSTSVRESFSLWRHYLCNNYTLFVTFGNSVNIFCPYVWNKCYWAHMRWVLGFGIKIGYDNQTCPYLIETDRVT